jgi:putative SOS response-associated peptidase YedK
MCGRYDLNVNALEIAARFAVALQNVNNAETGVPADEASNLAAWKAGWQPRYNIAPGQFNPVVVRDGSGDNLLELMRWGLVPAWSRDSKVSYSTINARAETVASKPTFRKALATQRCLVPATGYFEWMKDAGVAGASQGKQPYRIVLQNEGQETDGLFAFAGLFDVWHGPGGEKLHTYSIVTTRANDALSPIHSRMPVILPACLEEVWLDRDYNNVEKLVSLLQPYPEDKMAAYPVSKLVNSPLNDGRELIEPLVPQAA